MSADKVKFVKETIASHKVVIFSKTYCPYCTLAKEQFSKISVPVHVVELNNRDDGDEIQNVLGQMTGGRTVPRCFIDGKFVGGGQDVEKLYKSGELQTYFQ